VVAVRRAIGDAYEQNRRHRIGQRRKLARERISEARERSHARCAKARFVKAFSSVGAALMVNPKLPSRPTMFICGNDAAAKDTTRAILDTFGWETEDAGAVEAARAIEPLCMLWCIPGLLRNDWAHAFRVLR